MDDQDKIDVIIDSEFEVMIEEEADLNKKKEKWEDLLNGAMFNYIPPVYFRKYPHKSIENQVTIE
jgi:hypothetical protein